MKNRYDEKMVGKSTLAMFLAVLLLTVSNCAAACEMACFLRKAGFACRPPVQSSSATERLHVHCAHTRRSAEPKTAPRLSNQETSGCTHAFCRQPDSLLSSTENTQFTWARIVITIADETVPPALGLTSHYFVSEGPPTAVAPSFGSFSMALRI